MMSYRFYNDMINLLSNIGQPLGDVLFASDAEWDLHLKAWLREDTLMFELENETNLDNSFEAPEKLLT